MQCGHERVYSTKQIHLHDLPIGIGWRCDQHDNYHVGFDSVATRSSSWLMPYANTECQNGGVQIDWHGDRRLLPLENNVDDLILWIKEDRSITYYINGDVAGTALSRIPHAAFPVDFEISDAGNVPGYYRNLRWVYSPSQTEDSTSTGRYASNCTASAVSCEQRR